MTILQINKFYFLKGGAERYFFELSNLLKAKGHRVVPFSMQDDRNFPTPYEKFFVSHIDISKPRFSLDGLRSAVRIIWSYEARKKIKKLLLEEKPDIVHLHNIYHQISPSILSIFKKKKIPVVMTIHDFKLICPNYTLFSRGNVCLRCLKSRFYHCLLRKCIKNSVLASALCMCEGYVHRFLKIYEKNIDLFIAPSKFVKEIIASSGCLPNKKIVHLPLFVDTEKINPCFNFDNYFLYFGRLISGKGVETLIKAMPYVKAKSNLLICGTGPQEDKLKLLVKENNLDNVRFLGELHGDQLAKVIQKAMFCIFPSEVYETFGLSILEAFAFGKPVIASRQGGFLELIKERENGLSFKPGDVKDLEKKINFFLENKSEIGKMGRKARNLVETKYNPEKHYQKLIKIYTLLKAEK